ncbi:MAG: hypothetical protein OCD76_17075 [Reichenbachiella sp.]
MEKEEKKAYLLLKSVIFHYHGLDEDEEKLLTTTADKHDAHEELKWANSYIAEDFTTAFERSREYLKEVIGNLPLETRVDHLFSVWEDNNQKGYLTEMEATAMLNLAKDWEIDKELMLKVREA